MKKRSYTEPNVFLNVMETQLAICELEERRRQIANARGTKRYQRKLTKLIDKLYAVKWD